jgi:hypothetical protein
MDTSFNMSSPQTPIGSPSHNDQLAALRSGTLHRFADWPNKDMPRAAAGVYSIWNANDDFIYVGMAGRGKSAEEIQVASQQGKKTGLFDRLNSHASGARSGDQFCVYVQDLLLLPKLTTDEIDQIVTRKLALDRLVKDFVRENLSYRYVVTQDGAAAGSLERLIIDGALGDHPHLNPPSSMR